MGYRSLFGRRASRAGLFFYNLFTHDLTVKLFHDALVYRKLASRKSRPARIKKSIKTVVNNFLLSPKDKQWDIISLFPREILLSYKRD
jgi:hypothetical protein